MIVLPVSLDFVIFSILDGLGWFYYEFGFPGVIFCPGMVPDHWELDFLPKIEISLTT